MELFFGSVSAIHMVSYIPFYLIIVGTSDQLWPRIAVRSSAGGDAA